jgi:aldose 1-epimerase
MLDVRTQAMTTLVTLTSANGFEVDIADIGASIARISVPVQDEVRDVVLAYEDAEYYASDPFYLGATLGRYANRIRGGRFRLNGGSYQLATQVEHAGHTLHGGPSGFSRRRFQLDRSPDGRQVTCRYISKHGEQGFPGRLDVAVEYWIVGDSALVIDYKATADRSTILNLSNHSYFNLDGNRQTIADHELTVYASRYTPVDDEMIPTGDIVSVAGSPLDFRNTIRLADVLERDGGIDANFVIDAGDDNIRHAARLASPGSGICLDVHTTQPGIQVFTGNNLESPFRQYGGICLETQNFPDAPNQAAFPSATLLAGETYRQRSVYAFSVEP